MFLRLRTKINRGAGGGVRVLFKSLTRKRQGVVHNVPVFQSDLFYETAQSVHLSYLSASNQKQLESGLSMPLCKAIL